MLLLNTHIQAFNSINNNNNEKQKTENKKKKKKTITWHITTLQSMHTPAFFNTVFDYKKSSVFNCVFSDSFTNLGLSLFFLLSQIQILLSNEIELIFFQRLVSIGNIKFLDCLFEFCFITDRKIISNGNWIYRFFQVQPNFRIFISHI